MIITLRMRVNIMIKWSEAADDEMIFTFHFTSQSQSNISALYSSWRDQNYNDPFGWWIACFEIDE